MADSLPKEKKLTAQNRLKIVLEVIKGNKPVSQVCTEAGISRAFFYKLRKQYLEAGEGRGEKLRALEPKRGWKRNGRQLSRDQVKEIVAVILKNPEYGIPRILKQIHTSKHKKIVSHGGIQTLLHKLDLNTKRKRKLFVTPSSCL